MPLPQVARQHNYLCKKKKRKKKDGVIKKNSKQPLQEQSQ